MSIHRHADVVLHDEVRLADFHGRKAVLLVFYPLAFTGTCRGELTGIRDEIDLYANDVVQVLTVSVDSTLGRDPQPPGPHLPHQRR